jgi:hypothetical protein
MNHTPLVLDVPDGGRLLSRAFQDSGFCVVGGPEQIFGQDMGGWRPPAGKFDGIVGGPPCQVHSQASQIQGTNAVDLIPEWCAIIAVAKPAWFLMENVPQAPTPEIKGYVTASYLLNRLSLGVPKRRRRRFTFGVHPGRTRGYIAREAVDRWGAAMSDVLPKDKWPTSWFPSHPLDPPAAASDGLFDVPPQPALCAADHRGSRNIERPDGGMEGLPGWQKHDLQPALLASDSAGPGGKRAMGINAWTGKVVSLSTAWAHMGLPGNPPENWNDGSMFTKAGAIRLLGNGVPYDMGRHVARAVCLALGMADPGRVVREPDNSLFSSKQEVTETDG